MPNKSLFVALLCGLSLLACAQPEKAARSGATTELSAPSAPNAPNAPSTLTKVELASSQQGSGDEPVYRREAIAEKDGTVTERDNFQGVQVTAASVSFWRTCRPTKYFLVRGGAIIEAYSDSCRRRNGSWGGPTRWRGTCRSDVANCNGRLKCGRC